MGRGTVSNQGSEKKDMKRVAKTPGVGDNIRTANMKKPYSLRTFKK